jgi:hypothetical protein
MGTDLYNFLTKSVVAAKLTGRSDDSEGSGAGEDRDGGMGGIPFVKE